MADRRTPHSRCAANAFWCCELLVQRLNVLRCLGERDCPPFARRCGCAQPSSSLPADCRRGLSQGRPPENERQGLPSRSRNWPSSSRSASGVFPLFRAQYRLRPNVPIPCPPISSAAAPLERQQNGWGRTLLRWHRRQRTLSRHQGDSYPGARVELMAKAS